ncbi:maleylpyruvate isomerase N-terminal domain-containing protein [Streptomyces alboflavus]|uniref:maleylpyruvate isomerase N-terminal domain-containing protein n=1 Tax=Streptomyces alboflavus TaxID=67267 RepID=UPI003AB03AC5
MIFRGNPPDPHDASQTPTAARVRPPRGPVSLHPSLQTYADAWTHSVEAISELVSPLAEGEWNQPTPCPAWSVRDIVSHVIGLDCEMLGTRARSTPCRATCTTYRPRASATWRCRSTSAATTRHPR